MALIKQKFAQAATIAALSLALSCVAYGANNNAWQSNDATLPPPIFSSASQNGSAQGSGNPNRIHNWTVNGGIAVRTSAQAGSASYRWSQSGPSSYDLLIFGPLGAGTIHLIGNGGQVTLTNSKGQSTTARSPESLLQQQVGWSLPVSNMYYWIRGIPAPGGARATYNSPHQLATLQQNGWSIRYLSYTNANGMMLPSKIYMTRSGVSVRLSVNQWSI